MKKITTLQKSWIWNKSVEEFVKDKIKGHSLNICAGESPLGDVKIDLDPKDRSVIKGDMKKLKFKDETFDTVISDPPWKIGYYARKELIPSTHLLTQQSQGVMSAGKKKNNGQSLSIEKDLGQNLKTGETLQKSLLPNYQTSTLSLADSLAKVSVLLESGEDSKIREALYSLKLLGYSKISDLHIYFLRTLKDYSTTIRAIPLRQSSQPLMNWGMTVSGVCLTARISESPRIGKECSLSDILEENPDQKYFLSEKAMEQISKTIRKKH